MISIKYNTSFLFPLLFCILLLLILSSCSNGTTGTFTDARDDKKYTYQKMKDGKNWMTKNLNFDMEEGSYVYGDDEKIANIYGRFYDLNLLEKACPNGWHLPSKDEWINMIEKYGPIQKALPDTIDNIKPEKSSKTFIALTEGGSSGFNALLGGRRIKKTISQLGTSGAYGCQPTNEHHFLIFFSKEGIKEGQVFMIFSGTNATHNVAACRCVQD